MPSHPIPCSVLLQPAMVDPQGNAINHGVIVKLIATNICGSDLHMSAHFDSAAQANLSARVCYSMQ